MPLNRNALIRFKTLDHCLKNRQRRWTLEDLMQACSEALYEYEGIDKGVSRRTVQLDIQLMRSDKLGYNAPIVVLEKKYYTYNDPDYSITNIPLTDQDLAKLTEVAEILRQFKGFSHFQELSGMVQRLENKIHSAKTRQQPVIDFEKNDNLKGLEHIEVLYQAIVNQKPIELSYQSFKARTPNNFAFHPYFLKEYRNRWFVLGIKKQGAPVMNLALDRIVSITESPVKYLSSGNLNATELFRHVIGVTVNPDESPEHVVYFADQETAPYIATKPLHHSQKIVETLADGVVFSVDVQLNYELEREILGFGDRIKIISPERLKRRIRGQLENALDLYQYEFSITSLTSLQKKLEHKGFAILNNVYGRKEVNSMKSMIHNYLRLNLPAQGGELKELLMKIPELHTYVLNSNMSAILKKFSPGLVLADVTYYDRSLRKTEPDDWQQDNAAYQPAQNSVTILVHLDDIEEQDGPLKVIAGSHRQKLSDSEIKVISENSAPVECLVNTGGVHIINPQLLRAASIATGKKPRRVVQLTAVVAS